MTSVPPAPSPRSTRSAPLADLVELLQEVRQEILLREEDPSGAWVEQSAEELRSGPRLGWYFPPDPAGGGLSFAAMRGARAWGHVHARTPERAEALARALITSLPEAVRTASVGFTGLAAEAERTSAAYLAAAFGGRVIERYAMERTIRRDDGRRSVEPPPGVICVPARDVTAAALADLDWRSFRGTVDDALVGGSPEEYDRLISHLLRDGQGRLLESASLALISGEPPKLLAAILSSEVTARQAVFLDLMVDPDHRRKGYARFLVHHALRDLMGLGYARVRLWVTAGNDGALALYRAEGFGRVAQATILLWERSG